MKQSDALGYSQELNDLLVLPLDKLRQAAYQVHRCCGMLRVQGADELQEYEALPQDLQNELAELATSHWLCVIKHTEGLVDRLPANFDQAGPDEDVSYCSSVLHMLMEVWAVRLSLDDVQDVDFRRRFAAASLVHDRLDKRIRESDELVKLLSVVLGTSLIANWRLMLSDEFRDYPPWWLNGCLEAASAEIENAIE